MADSLNDALQELDEMSVVTSGDTLVINNDLRTITVPNNFIFGVYNDKNVLSVDFEMPRYYDDIDLSTFSIQINYQAASGVGNIYEITTPVIGTDKITFEWLLDRGVFLSAGDVTFIVCLREILSGSEGTVLREFNTTVARGKVLEGLEVEDPEDPEAYSIIAHLKSIDQRVTAQASDVANKFAAVSSMASEATNKYNEALAAINGAKEFYGSPLVAATAAGMTDQTKVYVYTGNETGYTFGNWYYYNGSAWVSGGVYNSSAVNTDETLSVSGMAADSKKVGDEISDLKEDLSHDISVLIGTFNDTNIVIGQPTKILKCNTVNAWQRVTLFEDYDFIAGESYRIELNYGKAVGSGYLYLTNSDETTWTTIQIGNSSLYTNIITPSIDHLNAKGEVGFSFENVNVVCKITNIREETDRIDKQMDMLMSIIDEEIANNTFVNGAISRTGAEVSSQTAQYYLISTVPIEQNVLKIKANNGYKLTAMAFNGDGTFAGFLRDKYTFTDISTTAVYYGNELEIDALREKYPNYSFRVELVNSQTASGTNTAITTDEESNAIFYKLNTQKSVQNYYKTELETTIESVRSTLTEPALVFPLVTDIHYLSKNNSFDYCINNLIVFCNNIKCDFIANLGDNTDGNVAQDITLKRNYYMLSRFNEIDLPYYHAIGNHDTNYYNQGSPYLFTSEQIYKSYLSNTHGVVFDMYAGEKNFYKDYPELGLRVVFVDANHGNSYRYSGRTASWLANTALDTDYIVILCEHMSSIATMNWNGQALVNGDAVTSVLQNFINNGGTLIQLCGHSHADYNFENPWLTIYSTCQKFESNDVAGAGYQAITGYEGSIVSPTRTLGSPTEDSWSVVVVKPISRTIELIRFGAGLDRSFSY